jgi:hypothetical protein
MDVTVSTFKYLDCIMFHSLFYFVRASFWWARFSHELIDKPLIIRSLIDNFCFHSYSICYWVINNKWNWFKCNLWIYFQSSVTIANSEKRYKKFYLKNSPVFLFIVTKCVNMILWLLFHTSSHCGLNAF